MKRTIVYSLLAVCITMMITACYKNKTDYNNNGGSNDYTIKMQNGAFSPGTLTVVLNSKVTWVNNDNTVHTVTATDGSFNSGDIAAGGSYSRTFTMVGTTSYYDIHNSSMTGVVVVTGTSGGGGY